MTSIEVIVQGLSGDLGLLKNTLGDFSESDFLVRPVPNANHAAWQLGHLIKSEAHMIGGIGGKMPELPAGFAEKFTKETAALDDAKAFLSKAELLALFEKTRQATIAHVKTLSADELDKPSPEFAQAWAPTVAAVCTIPSMHVMMHLGQFQVIRRKLGKPILF